MKKWIFLIGGMVLTVGVGLFILSRTPVAGAFGLSHKGLTEM